MTTEHPWADDLDFLLEQFTDEDACVWDHAGAVFNVSLHLKDADLVEGSKVYCALQNMDRLFDGNDGEIDITEDNEWDVPSTSDDVLYFRPDFYDYRDYSLFEDLGVIVKHVWNIDAQDSYESYIASIEDARANEQLKQDIKAELAHVSDKPQMTRRVM